MVERNSNYNRNNKSYNKKNNYKKFKPEGNVKKHGLLNFLFSFEGKISKNLFTGMALPLGVIALVLGLVKMSVQNSVGVDYGFLYTGLDIIYILCLWVIVALGYKRAHSLGISGIYSIVGTVLFKPFFCFYKADRDFANDAMYKNRFDGIKKFGAWFDKNNVTRIFYVLLFTLLSIIPYITTTANRDVVLGGESPVMNSVMVLMIIIALFNILQLFLFNTKWFKKYYVNILKVLSFIAYNLVVISMTIFIYTLFMLVSIQ